MRDEMSKPGSKREETLKNGFATGTMNRFGEGYVFASDET